MNRPVTSRFLYAFVFVLLSTVSFAGEPITVTGFQFGDNGGERSAELPSDFLANLTARGVLAPKATAAQRQTWPDVLAQGKTRQLVVVHTVFGTRIELLGLLIDEQGVCRLAVRRSGSTLFSARRDRGEPGPGQGLVNAYHELAADLTAAMAATPQGVAGKPLGVAVTERKAEGPSADALRAEHRLGLEAMLLATVVMEGAPATLSPAANSDISLSTRPRAIYFEFHLQTPQGQVLRPEVDRINLFPHLQRLFRQAEQWRGTVTGFRLLNPDWRPLAGLAVREQVALFHSGNQLFGLDASSGRELWRKEDVTTALAAGGLVYAEGKPGRGLVAAGTGEFTAVPETVGAGHPKIQTFGERRLYVHGRALTCSTGERNWHREFANPIGHVFANVGSDIFAFVDDGQFYVLESTTGDIRRQHEIGLRARSVAKIAERFWVTDMDARLAVVAPTDGSVLAEQQLADIPLLAPTSFEHGVCVVTKSRQGYLLNPDGAIVHRFTFPHRLHAAVLLADAQALVLADVAGALWLWSRDAREPKPYVALATTLTGPLVVAPSFIANWEHMTSMADSSLRLAEPSTQRLLLATDRDGFLYQIAYPF